MNTITSKERASNGPKYQLLSEDHEVVGSVVIAYRSSINIENYQDVYSRHGLDEIEPDAFYSMQKLVDVFNEIEQAPSDAMFDFVSIGMVSGEQIQKTFMENGVSFTDSMLAIQSMHYEMNRGADVGYFKVEVAEPGYLICYMRGPYPSDLYYGAIWAAARVRELSDFTVYYDTEALRFEDGGDETIIHVQWNVS